MKMINKILTTVVFSSLLLSGCKKELELRPTDVVDASKAFLSVDDLYRGTMDVYRRYNLENGMYFNALITDEVAVGPDNNGQGQFEFRHQYGQDPTTGGTPASGWSSLYFMINQANLVLQQFDVIKAQNPAEEARKSALRAQLLALRGMAHFELLYRYTKGEYNASDLAVPIMLKTDIFGQPARRTSAEVMSRIETDLADAAGLLPTVTPSTFNDTVINRITVNAFQARAALYKKDWQTAVNRASDVINSNVRPLVSGAAFSGIWTDAPASINNEVILRLKRFGTSTGDMWTTTTGLVYFSPASKLRGLFDQVNDVRFASYFVFASGKWTVNKFFQGPLGARINDAKAIRTAEMYLIRAEAYAMLGGATNILNGAADLNLLRSRRINGYTNQVFATSTDLVNAVIEERYKELCFEGFRFMDIKRRNQSINRASADVASPAWQDLLAGNFRFAFPIPFQEIQSNKSMVQNPGY